MGPAFRERLVRACNCTATTWCAKHGPDDELDEITRDLMHQRATYRDMVRADARELSHARGFHRELVLRLRADLRAARAAGATLGELATDTGLSRSRVAQITGDEPYMGAPADGATLGDGGRP